MKHLSSISVEPISIQYDQTLNRLKDMSNEVQVKFSEIRQINPTRTDDSSFEQNYLQLLTHFENTQENITHLISDREQIQTSAQTVDQTVSIINQNVKSIRTNLVHYRLSNENLDEFQVSDTRKDSDCHQICLFKNLSETLNHEDTQLKLCSDALNELQPNLNDTDRNEYTNHIR